MADAETIIASGTQIYRQPGQANLNLESNQAMVEGREAVRRQAGEAQPVPVRETPGAALPRPPQTPEADQRPRPNQPYLGAVVDEVI